MSGNTPVWLAVIAVLLFAEAALGGRLLAVAVRAATAYRPALALPAPLLGRYGAMALAFVGFLVQRGAYFTYRWLLVAGGRSRLELIEAPPLGDRLSWEGLAYTAVDPATLVAALVAAWVVMELLRAVLGLNAARAALAAVTYHGLIVLSAVLVVALFKVPEAVIEMVAKAVEP